MEHKADFVSGNKIREFRQLVLYVDLAANAVVSLFHWPQIAIQPVERFLYHLIAGNIVAGIEDHPALVLWRRSQEDKHRFLRGSCWEDVIESTVQHQGGDLYPWRKVQLIVFRKLPIR